MVPFGCSYETSARACAVQARNAASLRSRRDAPGILPTVDDLDRVIALLENAEAEVVR